MQRKPKMVFFTKPNFRFLSPVKVKAKTTYNYLTRQAKTRPLTLFVLLLALLFAFIFAASTIAKPKEKEEEADAPTKEVQVFNIGKAPTIKLNAQIQKDGVVQIVAQAPGIVSKVHIKNGQAVTRGTTLISTGVNYLGANPSSVQRQLAQTQLASVKNTFELQKEIIAKQKDAANKTDATADELRDITSKSLDDTRAVILQNESILSSIDTNLKNLQDTNVGGTNDAVILQTEQLRAQLLAGLSQARSNLRQSEFQSAGDKPPAQLSDLQREIAQKQLDLQEKSLELSVDTARLQLKLAQITESIMYPASPFEGIVQRVHVKVGQTVAPGAPLVTISSSGKSTTAIALLPKNIAESITKLENSYLIIGAERIEVTTTYISTEATNGQLYSAVFALPQEYQDRVTDLGFVDVEVPIGSTYTLSSFPFVPLDAVHQTQDKAVVFTVEGDRAKGKEIILGEVQGDYVQVISGLTSNDQLILNRNILSGDRINIVSQEI